MAIKIKSKKNLLDFVPIITNKNFDIVTKEDTGLSEIIMHRNSLMDKFVRVFIKKTPKTFVVSLDEYGSFVLSTIDGKRNIYEIGILCKNKFGDDVEPLYERLGAFCNLLKNNNFIKFVD